MEKEVGESKTVVDKKIADIENKFAQKLRATSPEDDRAVTMVFGGVGTEEDKDEAREWIVN